MDTKVIQKIAEHLGLSAQDVDKVALLREDLGLGPVELTDLINDISTSFDITFAPEEVASLQTVEDLIMLVEDNSIE